MFPHFRAAKTDVKVRQMAWQWCGMPPLSVYTLKGLFHRDGKKKEMKVMSFFFFYLVPGTVFYLQLRQL